MSELIRTVFFDANGTRFRLRLWDIYKTDGRGKIRLRYKLSKKTGDEWVAVFHDDDFCCSPLHAIDSDETVEAVMSFLTLRPGDVEEEYFEGYTDEQLAFRDEYAEALACEVMYRFSAKEGA